MLSRQFSGQKLGRWNVVVSDFTGWFCWCFIFLPLAILPKVLACWFPFHRLSPMMSSYEYVSAELVTFTEICWWKVDWKIHGGIFRLRKVRGKWMFIWQEDTFILNCAFPGITAHIGHMWGLAKREISNSHSRTLNPRRRLIISHLDASFWGLFCENETPQQPSNQASFLKREEKWKQNKKKKALASVRLYLAACSSTTAAHFSCLGGVGVLTAAGGRVWRSRDGSRIRNVSSLF